MNDVGEEIWYQNNGKSSILLTYFFSEQSKLKIFFPNGNINLALEFQSVLSQM